MGQLIQFPTQFYGPQPETLVLMMTRDQLRHKTLSDNPELKQTDTLFRKAFVFNANVLHGGNAERFASRRVLAEYLGMSVGEVTRHLISIARDIGQANEEVAAKQKAIEDYESTQTTQETTDNAPPTDTDAGSNLNPLEETLDQSEPFDLHSDLS